jgi:DNA-binding LacI/PurR family transcriptional regulator
MAAAAPLPKIEDICARTGLAHSTVSLALRGLYGVSPQTRERVLAAAADLGYDMRRIRGSRPHAPPGRRVRSPAAPAPAAAAAPGPAGHAAPAAPPPVAVTAAPTAERLRAGIVYPAGTGLDAIARAVDFGRYLRGIQRAAQSLATDLLFLPAVDGDLDPLVRLTLAGGDHTAEHAAEHPFHGLILLGMGADHPAVHHALQRSAPVVLLNRFEPDLRCSWVSVDHVEAAAAVTCHLVQQGYREIVFVADRVERMGYHRQRLEGFRSAVAALASGDDIPAPTYPAAPADPAHRNTASASAPIATHERLVDSLDEPLCDDLAALVRSATGAIAIFAVSDRRAVRIKQALAERGLETPRDYGLAGYDNLADELTGGPAGITSVAFPREEMGALALHVLRDLRERPLLERQQVFIHPQLIPRASTVPPVGSRQ